MGPGIVGQLITNEAGYDSCNDCHAPLLEQRPRPGGADANPLFNADLRSSGVGCASCHVRQGQVHGPTRREGRDEPGPGFPHGGYVEHVDFEGAGLCANCHQFSDDQRRMNGVLIEDTWNEWKASPWGQRDEPCQSCHMPDRRHLWRGIHDPEFTESALAIDLQLSGKRSAVYTVKNEAVGHNFPTYVTPRVSLIIQAIDGSGQVVGRQVVQIQRRIDIFLSDQPYDTRIRPGESALVALEWRKKDKVRSVQALLLVEPDEFYSRFYANHSSDSPQASKMILQAADDATANTYAIGERTLDVR